MIFLYWCNWPLFIIATLSIIFGSNVDSIYVKGNEYYLQGDFNDAIDNYEKILSLNNEHQDLYFNLGNAYFRNKEVGNAIWSYEKAKLFSPRDKDINFNLNYLQKIRTFFLYHIPHPLLGNPM